MVVKKTTVKETPEVDIQALIKEAVTKAIAEASKSSQLKIDELEKQLSEKEAQQEITVNSIKPDKMVGIMHMAPGSASFIRGRVNIKFNKLFDERRIKFEILDEMYYAFKEWFDTFEIVILDKEVREYFNIDYSFKEHGADKSKFQELLKIDNMEMLKELNGFSPVVAWAFLEFFLQEYIKGNSECLRNNKYNEVQNHYSSKYAINSIQEMTNEMIS